MTEAAAQTSTLAAKLSGITDADARAKALARVNPLYDQFRPQWEVLLDAMDGSGGFLSGGYLWKFPRELDNKFKERQAQARYHNYVESLVEIYVRHLFGRGVTRTSTSDGLQEFWKNVDGSGAEMTDYLKTQTALALATGHTGILMDKPPDVAAGPSKADDKAAGSVPFLRAYTPIAILDWRTQQDEIVSLKLAEAAPSDDVLEVQNDDEKQYLIWDKTGWLRTDAKGDAVTTGEPNLGVVPFHVLRAKKMRRYPFLGKSLVNATLVKALYNRGSEEDDVLRNQAFSVFTISLPNGATAADVKATKDELGGEIGTTSALVVLGDADYKTPDMQVPETIRDNQLWLIQEIYRMAHMRYQKDSLVAETAEAIRLQHTELNEMLVGLAGELRALELAMAKYYFLWTEATADLAEKAFESAEVNIEYPKEFFLRELSADLEDWANAIRLSLGKTFTTHVKKQAVRRMFPDLDEETLTEIDAEIDKMPDDAQMTGVSMADQLRGNAAKRLLKSTDDQAAAAAAAAGQAA